MKKHHYSPEMLPSVYYTISLPGVHIKDDSNYIWNDNFAKVHWSPYPEYMDQDGQYSASGIPLPFNN